MKRLISAILSILLVFSILPLQGNVAHALSTALERTEYPRSEAEFHEMLNLLNVESRNVDGLSVNWNTFKNKKLIVYGNPFGDLRNGEFRYLGYNADNQVFTNSDFPPDPGSVGDNPSGWNFLFRDENLESCIKETG